MKNELDQLLSSATDAGDVPGVLAMAFDREGITYEGALGTITFPYGINNDPADSDMEDKWWHQFPDPAITMIQYQEPGEDSAVSTVVYPEIYQTDDAIWVSAE